MDKLSGTGNMEKITEVLSLEKRPVILAILNATPELQERVLTLIDRKKKFTEKVHNIITLSKKNLAEIAGLVLNDALSIPVKIAKIRCIKAALIDIQEKLDKMPIEALYTVYTSSSPYALAIQGFKKKLDDAIDVLLDEKCAENLPKLTKNIDSAYAAAESAAAIIDRLSNLSSTEEESPAKADVHTTLPHETAIQLAEDRRKNTLSDLDTHKQSIQEKLQQDRKLVSGGGKHRRRNTRRGKHRRRNIRRKNTRRGKHRRRNIRRRNTRKGNTNKYKSANH